MDLEGGLGDSLGIDSLEPAITRLASKSIKTDSIPGLSIGVVRGDYLSGYFSFGTHRLGTESSPAARAISRVASITKTFTATAILQLRDLGQLELDDPLLLHMPDFTVASALHGTLEAVTIRRLMTHYSGLRTEHPLTDWDAPSFPTTDALLNGLAAIEVVIPQDSQWKYSNLGVGLLGHVIEHISGVPYERYVYEEITAPLGLENTTFELRSDQSLLKATGYSHPVPGSDEIRESPYSPLRGIAAAGQLHSNVEDLAKWMSFQFTSGRSTHPSKVLTASTLAEMHRPVYMSENWLSGQAIGWRMSRRGNLVLHNHGGGIQGFASNMVFSVKAQTGVIVLANIWPAPTVAVLSEDIAEFVIRELGPVSEKLQTDLHPLSEDRARAYLGHYWAEPGIYVDVLYQNGELSLVSPREIDYSLHSPADLQADPSVSVGDSFRVVGGRGAGELAEFSRGDSDKVKAFRLGGFLYKRVD